MEIINFEKRDLINYKTEKFRMSFLVLGPGIYGIYIGIFLIKVN